MQWLDSIPYPTLIIICLTLGLAPFAPPHVVEKLTMLANGELHKGIDIFDLLMHGMPWVLLIVKFVRQSVFKKA